MADGGSQVTKDLAQMNLEPVDSDIADIKRGFQLFLEARMRGRY